MITLDDYKTAQMKIMLKNGDVVTIITHVPKVYRCDRRCKFSTVHKGSKEIGKYCSLFKADLERILGEGFSYMNEDGVYCRCSQCETARSDWEWANGGEEEMREYYRRKAKEYKLKHPYLG